MSAKEDKLREAQGGQQEAGASAASADSTPPAAQDSSLLKEQHKEVEEIGAGAAPELTKRQKFWQITLGWLAGFLIWLCMALGLMNQGNELLNWSFLIVFAAAMFGRNAVERRTGMDLRLYMRSFLISLIVFLVVFVIVGPVMHLLPEN